MATTDTDTQSLESFRVAMLEELGFSKDEAESLSGAYYQVKVPARKGQGVRRYDMRVDHHYVRRMMDAGATREQILRIIL